MDAVHPLIQALYETPFATSIRESEWTFPVIQTFHILGVLLFYGGIALVDLRILGVILRQRPTIDVANALLPLAWVGFAGMALSGSLLFAAQAAKIYSNVFLLTKFGLIALAGLNLAAFHLAHRQAIKTWGGEGATAPADAKAMAAVSFALWTGVVIAGRFIAYF